MRTDMTVAELATEVGRQAKAKTDFLAPASAIRVDDFLRVHIDGITESWDIAPIAHRQIGEYTGVPFAYYDRLKADAPDLLAYNLNHWLQSHGSDIRLSRHLDGRMRALLSNRYRPLDYIDLLTATMPILASLGEFEVKSCSLTESRLYLKVVTPRLTGDVRVGDTVQGGIIVQDSEVGAGAVSVKPFTHRLICTNGMIHADYGAKSAHIGRALSGGSDDDFGRQYYSDATREAEDVAFWMRFGDTIRGVLSEETFAGILQTYRTAAETPIESPTVAVEAVSQRYGFSEAEQATVLENMVTGKDYTVWGLMNAVTRTAEDLPSYDRATELEGRGAALLALDPSEWVTISARPRRQ